MRHDFTRRHLILGLPLALAGCAASAPYVAAAVTDPRYAALYGTLKDPPYTIPALDLAEIDPSVLRQDVPYRGSYQPGTVIISIRERRLYLVEDGGRAWRFGIGVGREEGLNFRGSAIIGRKAKWPSWTPTPNMIAHIPKYAAYADGMRGGLGNPLGARALYLYRNDEDTHFRVHGTNEPKSIGKAASSGCIRLFNHDIIYLYDRLGIGTPVVVQREAVSEGLPR
jgi:lipoprotein-anchoring transpeptidase ErfK/SrfK